MEMTAITLTFSTLISVIFLFVGGVIGWLAKEQSYQTTYTTFTTHPEMFDANGNVVPDEILAVRFENDHDTDTENEEGDEE